MQDKRSRISRGQAAHEAAVGRGFVVWIAVYALLVLSLFVFHAPGKLRPVPEATRISHVLQPQHAGAAITPAPVPRRL